MLTSSHISIRFWSILESFAVKEDELESCLETSRCPQAILVGTPAAVEERV